MFGLVTTKTHKASLAAQKRAFAAALALASGNLTIDSLRTNATERLEMVVGVKLGLEQQIAEITKKLADLNAQRDHAMLVAEDLGSIIDVLPEGVSVMLDPLVYQVAEQTEEKNNE